MIRMNLAIALALGSAAPSLAQEVRSYASQINDVDSVNTHWLETDAGVVVIDTQRIIPEAEQAIDHLRASTDRPVIAIFLTHPHTDHYGGLPAWKCEFPDAVIYASETTLASIREDGRGFNAARRERHGEHFATQTQFEDAVLDAQTIADGQDIRVGNIVVTTRLLRPSESEGTTIVSIPAWRIVFVGDLVNVGVPAVPFEDLSEWLLQLDMIEADYGGYRLYQGHGVAPVSTGQIVTQRRFLRELRSAVTSRIDDGILTEAKAGSVAFELEGSWPFLMGVAGNTRRQIFVASARMVAEQLGATVER